MISRDIAARRKCLNRRCYLMRLVKSIPKNLYNYFAHDMKYKKIHYIREILKSVPGLSDCMKKK